VNGKTYPRLARPAAPVGKLSTLFQRQAERLLKMTTPTNGDPAHKDFALVAGRRAGAMAALLLVLASTPAVHAQAQRWVVPPSVIDFTAAGPTVAPLPGPPVTNYAAANGVVDSNGTLLFFVVANRAFGWPVFDASGGEIGVIGKFAGSFLSHQIAVFAVPGFCDRYYIFYFGSQAFVGLDLYYSVVDVAQKQIVQHDVLLAHYSDNRGAFAVSRLRSDGSRLLYTIASPTVQKFVVGPTGVALNSTLLNPGSSGYDGSDFGASQAALSSDGRKLAWSGGFGSGNRIVVADLDANGDYIGLTAYPFGEVAGLEFSADATKLFLSPPLFPDPAAPLSYIDFNTNPATKSSIAGSIGYAGSLLQLAADGMIYAAGASGLGAVNPTTPPSFKPNAVPGIVTGTQAGSPIGGSRTLPYQIDGEAQLTCENLCGNPALVQSTFGVVKGMNFEVVVPFPGSGIAHYWRDNDISGNWSTSPIVFGAAAGAVDSVSLIESSYGHLEVVVRVGDRLAHFWRASSDPNSTWSAPTYFASGVSGTSSLTQVAGSTFGNPANFEVVTPLATGGIAHFVRDNSAAGQNLWTLSDTFALPYVVADVSLIQGSFFDNLEVVARIGDQLAHYWRDASAGKWFGPIFFAAGVSGTPSLIQGRFGTPGNFELVAPLAAGGMGHFWRDSSGPFQFQWFGPIPFGSGSVRSVALIQSSYGNNLEVVARVNCSLDHYWRGSEPFTWSGPTTIVP
jgi:hypothetical protein